MQTMPQQITVQADQKISITFPAGIWSQILSVIQEAPISWARAHPLVQMLGEQLQQSVEGGGSGMKPNGLDTSETRLTPQ
jgi:hypothetical protein